MKKKEALNPIQKPDKKNPNKSHLTSHPRKAVPQSKPQVQQQDKKAEVRESRLIQNEKFLANEKSGNTKQIRESTTQPTGFFEDEY